ncbi:helix-turn-helix transcriptional regulator [Marivita hallyeonensis]|uniref:DNA binding domain-containing protein, excisionase family n=1 Tax=Marivita hallyeonensis TaxID=996342 RepID=A0A1M5NIW3_9RHOB|nr:helix-turn-helix transcriptional regulator [Marivita hallyeonensis]SHG89458.1 DNA binding domain-containing protein, excisionase family [Marivita hallyeonensis]
MLNRNTSSPERYLTVPELAELLRIKERKVYDLASSGTVPCSKVTGKLLFPEQAVHRWLAQGQSGESGPDAARPSVFLGSHDPLLDWTLRQSECGIATFFDGSQDGLDRFANREGLAAGIHIFDAASGDWNVPAAARFEGEPVALLAFAKRRRGLVLRRNLSSQVTGVADLVGRKVTPRQPGAGTQILFDHLLAQAGVAADALRFGPVARSEADAVFDVVSEDTDVTFGLEVLAHQHKLGFVPLIEERFDLLVSRRAYFEPPMQRFVRFLTSEAFKDHAGAMPGYDVSEAGTVRWNG